MPTTRWDGRGVRRGVFLGVIACGAVVAAGCGSAQTASRDLGSVVKKTEGERTGKYSVTFAATQGQTSLVLYRLSGTFDNARRLQDATMDLRPFIRQQPASQRVGKVSDWLFEFLSDSSHPLLLYLRSPLFAESTFQKKLPPRGRNRPWIKFDIAATLRKKASVLGPTMTSQLSGLLPGLGSPLAFLDAVALVARSDGSEQLSGVNTSRYRADADFARHAADLPRNMAKLLNLAKGAWKTRVWVSDGSLIRRVEATSPAISGFQGGRVVVTWDFSHLGEAVKIQLPSADQVLDPFTMLPK